MDEQCLNLACGQIRLSAIGSLLEARRLGLECTAGPLV